MTERRMEIETRSLSIDDIGELVAIHNESFPFGLSSLCSVRYKNGLYSGLIKESAFTIGVEVGGELVGYAIADYSRKIAAKGESLRLSLVTSLVRSAIMKPRRFVISVTYFLLAKSMSVTRYIHCKDRWFSGEKVVLSHIAVASDFRSLGLGKLLISELESQVVAQEFSLICTYSHNTRLVEYYTRVKKAFTLRKRSLLGLTSYYVEWLIGECTD